MGHITWKYNYCNWLFSKHNDWISIFTVDNNIYVNIFEFSNIKHLIVLFKNDFLECMVGFLLLYLYPYTTYLGHTIMFVFILRWKDTLMYRLTIRDSGMYQQMKRKLVANQPSDTLSNFIKRWGEIVKSWNYDIRFDQSHCSGLIINVLEHKDQNVELNWDGCPFRDPKSWILWR